MTKSWIVAKCEVGGELHCGKRLMKLYSGKDQKTVDANLALVLRVQADIRRAIYDKYYPQVERKREVEKAATAKLLRSLQHTKKAYLIIEKWVLGSCYGVVATFPRGRIKELRDWYEANEDGSCALIPFLTDGTRQVRIELYK